MIKNVKAAILAGGQGARFWPVSRRSRPKQFLRLGGTEESLIQATGRRIGVLVGESNVIVVTNDQLAPMVREHVAYAEVLAEPVARNTAASIGLAAVHAHKQSPETVLLVLPADHAVKDEDALRATLSAAIDAARSGEHLVTVGIPPAGPNTAYGYIQRGAPLQGRVAHVKRFYEKPSLERAIKYCEAGDFFWNSGMFIWRADTILAAIREHMPALYAGLQQIEAAIGTAAEKQVTAQVFAGLESVSIDFGVLELAKNCVIVEALPFGWNDVGSWDAWAEHFKPDAHGNLLHGQSLAIEANGCVVHADTSTGSPRFVALLGVQDLVVIDSGDAVLICPRDRVQDVRKVVDALKGNGRSDLT